MKVSIILSLSNKEISEKLYENIVNEFNKFNCEIKTYEVQGCLEIPRIANKLIQKNESDAIICAGVVLKFDSPMFEFMGNSIFSEILKLSTYNEIPLFNAIIMSEKKEDALSLSEGYGVKIFNSLKTLINTEKDI